MKHGEAYDLIRAIRVIDYCKEFGSFMSVSRLCAYLGFQYPDGKRSIGLMLDNGYLEKRNDGRFYISKISEQLYELSRPLLKSLYSRRGLAI